MADPSGRPPPPDPDPTQPPGEEAVPGRGLDVAREALAAARAAARARAREQRRGEPAARRRPRSESRSGARPDDRDPQLLARTLDRLLAERGWEVDLAVGGVLGRWDSIVGPDLAAHCRPESFRDGVLTVTTDSTAWATQMRMLAVPLLRRLNDEVGSGTVTRVRVLGPAAPSWVRGRLSVRGRGPRDTYG